MYNTQNVQKYTLHMKIQSLINSNSKTEPLAVRQWPLILSVDWSKVAPDLDYVKNFLGPVIEIGLH